MVIREHREHQFSSDQVRQVLDRVLGDMHAKRGASLSDALGVMRSSSLAVCAIGQGFAAARGPNPKHATKQVGRLLSNPKINVDDIFAHWVPYIVGARTAMVMASDWTEFDAGKQATIMLSLKSQPSMSTVRLAELLPAGITVCVVADRGFCDQKLYRMLNEELCFDYVMRFRGDFAVTATTGETRTAAARVRENGRARELRGAEVTADRYRVAP
jgi:hypothetical protein